MSPDDAPTDTSQTAAEAPAAADEAVKEKKSFKERMAFLDKGGEKMDKYPGINKIPRSMRVLTILIVLVLILAIIMAWPSGEKAPPKDPSLDVANLEDWSWTSDPMSGEMSEFQNTVFTLSSLMGSNETAMSLLLDHVEMTVTWEDEPDQTWAGRVRENSPDSFQVEIHAIDGNITVTSDMTPNDQGSGQGSVSIILDMSSQNYTYLMVGNTTTSADLPEDILETGLELIMTMGEAGDFYASGPALFKLNDTGNAYTLTVSASGKIIPAE